MKVLVTAGSTWVPIDHVRGITNIFKGQTGASIAQYFAAQLCDTTLLTSSPTLSTPHTYLQLLPYHSFDDLAMHMEQLVRHEHFDAIIHSAAVSDYLVVGIDGAGEHHGKISSEHEELILHLKRAPKLVDQLRNPWGFTGALVKFKLEVGLPEDALLFRAQKSMVHSGAELIVANCLEWAHQSAQILYAGDSRVDSVSRKYLPEHLYHVLSRLTQKKQPVTEAA